jgi:hypothetical protein
VCMLNKQPRTKIRGGPPAWGLRVGPTTLHCKKLICYEEPNRSSDLDAFFLDKKAK